MVNKYSLYQILFFGFLGVGLIGVALWMWHEQRQYAKTGTLTVGLIHGLPAGTSGDAHNGFDWEVAFAISQKLHKQLKRQALYVPEIVDALKNEDVDFVSGHLSITRERLKKMAMVHIYGDPYPYLTFLFWGASYQQELKGVQHINDVLSFFEKHDIGVLGRGSIWEGLMKSYGFKHIKPYDDEPQMVRALKDGDITAMVMGRVSTDYLLNQYANLWGLKLELDEPYNYGVGIALSKERKDLVKQVAEAIQALKEDGTINMLQQKWFGKRY